MARVDESTLRVATATREALNQRGTTFDRLTHAQQFRLADLMGASVPDMHAALGQLDTKIGGNMTFDTRTGMTTGGDTEPKMSGVGVRWTGQGPEWVQEMLADPTCPVWSTVVVLEERLGVKTSGTRCERYDRVQKRLAKLRKRSLSGKLSEREDDLIDRYRRRLKAVEDQYMVRQREAGEALGSLARQSAAVRYAAGMGA